jgi:hypothetical protein
LRKAYPFGFLRPLTTTAKLHADAEARATLDMSLDNQMELTKMSWHRFVLALFAVGIECQAVQGFLALGAKGLN